MPTKCNIIINMETEEERTVIKLFQDAHDDLSFCEAVKLYDSTCNTRYKINKKILRTICSNGYIESLKQFAVSKNFGHLVQNKNNLAVKAAKHGHINILEFLEKKARKFSVESVHVLICEQKAINYKQADQLAKQQVKIDELEDQLAKQQAIIDEQANQLSAHKSAIDKRAAQPVKQTYLELK